MSTKFSIESRLTKFLREQDMSVEFFVALLPYGSISVSRLRQALRGDRPLENTYHATLDSMLRDLEALAAEHAPIRVRWEHPRSFQAILDARHEQPDDAGFAVETLGDFHFPDFCARRARSANMKTGGRMARELKQPIVPIALEPERLLTRAEIAEYLRITETTVYQMTRKRQRNPMPCVRVGGKFLRFRLSEVSRWLDQCRKEVA